MTIEQDQPAQSAPNAIEAARRHRFKPATIVFVVSLLALLGSGWLKSGGLKLVISGLSAALLIGALIKIFRSLDFSSPRLINGTPRQLAWIRIMVCLTALIYTLMDDLPAFASLPLGIRDNQQFFRLLNSLPAYSAFVSHSHWLGALQYTTAALLFLGLIGFQTRPALLLGSVGFFSMQAILRDYTYQYHSGFVLVYLLLLLPWTPCAATWSVDRWLSRSKQEPRPQSVGLAIYACFIVMAMVYLMSGLSKLRDSGLNWFRGDNIEQKLVQDALTPIFLDYKWKASIWLVQHHTPDFVFTVIGTVALIAELGYLTVLFSRTARIVMPIFGFGIHLGILVLQHILFLDLLMLQFIFLNADWLARVWRRRLRTIGRAASVQTRIDSPQLAYSFIPVSAVALTVAVLLIAWAWRVEYYPLTSWRMYSSPERKGPLQYFKIVATLEDGSSINIPIHDLSPAVLPNARYLLTKAFRAARRSKIFDAFLASYVQRRNRSLAFGSPITRIEVQRWRWNYVAEPNDPRFGWIIGAYPLDATSNASPSR